MGTKRQVEISGVHQEVLQLEEAFKLLPFLCRSLQTTETPCLLGLGALS